MRHIALAGAGFLIAVLWFDLMFDVQVWGEPRDNVVQPKLDSIGAYYARVTTAARPMNRLVAFAMLALLASLVGELIRGELPSWRSFASLVFTVFAIGRAGSVTVPNAIRLGAQHDDAATQSCLAHSILRDHIGCFIAIAAAIALQLAPA